MKKGEQKNIQNIKRAIWPNYIDYFWKTSTACVPYDVVKPLNNNSSRPDPSTYIQNISRWPDHNKEATTTRSTCMPTLIKSIVWPTLTLSDLGQRFSTFWDSRTTWSILSRFADHQGRRDSIFNLARKILEQPFLFSQLHKKFYMYLSTQISKWPFSF